MEIELDSIPLIDHHCHTIVDNALGKDVKNLIRNTSEASENYPLSDLKETLTFEYMKSYVNKVSNANCDSMKDLENLFSNINYNNYVYKIFRDNNYAQLFVDTGFHPRQNIDLDEMSNITGTKVFPVLRIEKLAEDIKMDSSSFSEWWERILENVKNARKNGYIGAKSIIAYRSGLKIEPVSLKDAKQAFQSWGKKRLENDVLLNFLIWEIAPILAEHNLPLQFHVGYGDSDTDLLKGNPLLLRCFIEEFTPKGLKLTLLHTYPYHREAGYLTSVYSGVYFDISLIIPLGAFGATRVMSEALELAPLSRFLFASDAHTRPELYGLGAELYRKALHDILYKIFKQNIITTDKVYNWAEMVLHQNAFNLYWRK